MNSISEEKAKKYGICTVMSAFLAVFCLFGYRSSFSIMQGLIIADTGWSTIQTSLGYCIMMTIDIAGDVVVEIQLLKLKHALFGHVAQHG